MYLKLIAGGTYPKFEVYDEDKLVVRIKIDLEMQALRVTYKEKLRAFFVVEEKHRRNPLLRLVNEYSQPLGTLIKDKSNNSGEIEIDGMKLKYESIDWLNNEINLFESNNPAARLNCKIEDEASHSAFSNINYLLFALSWFTFLVKQEKQTFQFA